MKNYDKIQDVLFERNGKKSVAVDGRRFLKGNNCEINRGNECHIRKGTRRIFFFRRASYVVSKYLGLLQWKIETELMCDLAVEETMIFTNDLNDRRVRVTKTAPFITDPIFHKGGHGYLVEVL